jgi:phosphatidate cytidylyltransferase
MLGWRLAISAVLIPALIGLFWLDAAAGESAWVLLVLCVLLAIRASWEMVDLLRTRAMQPAWLPVVVCSVGIILAGWFRWGENGDGANDLSRLAAIGLAFSFSVLLLMLHSAVRYRQPGGQMESLGAELLVTSYVGVLLAVTAQLRWVAGHEAGYLVLGSLVIAAKAGDIGGYTVGRLFGKRKMTPYLSPGKTWMGALGAVVFAGAGGCLWLHFAAPYFLQFASPPATVWAVCYGVCIGVVGLIGDLCESLVKRDVEKKDSATLLPGFGGLLDLLDSVLYAGPVAYLLWQVIPLRTW